MEPTTQASFTEKARDTIARVLDHVLAEECSLAARTRDYRWNVTGPNLYSLHRLFDEQRQQLDYWLDRVIERARSIGFPKERHEEPSGGTAAGLPPRTMIGDLLARHEAMAGELRADIERLRDPATAELLTRLVEFHETSAWMLRMLHSGAGSDRRA
jgi:starvation-inducible DNA-binding protein